MSPEPSGPAQNEPPILAVEVKSTMLAWWGQDNCKVTRQVGD
jgi:hypothetical protein